MEQVPGFLLTFAVGSVGYVLFRICRVPNPAMLGAMFATGAMNVAGYYPDFSTAFISFAANLLIGMMIGRQIDRSIFERVVAMAKPVAFQMAGIFSLSLFCGYSLYLMSGGAIPLATALISGAAGGITEMIIFGLSVDADVAVIAFVQLFRVVIFLSIIPYIAMVCEKLGVAKPGEKQRSQRLQLSNFARNDYIWLTLCALAGSLLGIYFRIPSGGLIGAMLACGAFALAVNKKYKFNSRLRVVAQIGLGLVLGQRMTPQIVGQLGDMFLPALFVTAIMLVGCVLLAFLLRANTGWDLTTCLLCAAPAGLSQITVYADEIGVDSFTASVFHTVRIVGIVSFYPWIIMPLI